jgi:hypothetical protein
MSELDTDRPSTSATADVALVTRALTVTAGVDASSATTLVVRPESGGLSSDHPVRPGDLVEVYWAAADEERSLPARVAEVDGDGAPRWHLTITGPSGRSQRRKAVRAAVALPVSIPWAGGQASGLTEDLSEAGLRARVDGWGLPPDAGTPLVALLTVADDEVVRVRGQVVRVQDRGGAWVISLQFAGLPDADADRLRRRVFAALREERAAAADD